MKKLLLSISIFATTIGLQAQNLYPTTGNVFIDGKIGSTISTTEGITWSLNSPHYGIYRTIGAWSAPNYQQLQINWATGLY